MSLALSAYFTTKSDPQRRNKRYPADHWKLIEPWYIGLVRCGIRGVVLHDGCSEEFCSRHTDDHLSFHKVELGPYTTNVERFFHYHDYLVDYPQDAGMVVCTDLFDVSFNQNPFDLISRRRERLFFGVFEQFSPNIRREWNRQAYGDPDLLYNKPYLAATAFGGFTLPVLELLGFMIKDFQGINPRHNVDMSVIHKCAWTHFEPDQIFYGSPFTGNLKTGAYRYNDCIIHLRHNREDHGVKR